MLRVGLTGGIGSGKSTVARRLVERGALLVDSDVLAREVVEPGTAGLAEIVAAFGSGVLDADGALDRPALASTVFRDAAARAHLNGIVHPRVRRRSDELIAAAPADVIVVQDVPLLVEAGMGSLFPLVVVVHAAAETRVRRLVDQRGMSEADAMARIASQTDDDARRAAADVWLDNSGGPADLGATVDALWDRRLVTFEENLRLRHPVRAERPRLVEPDPGWAAQAARLVARVARVSGRGVVHIGSTAVPGLPAADVIDLQVAVDALADADGVRDALQEAGFPWFDHARPLHGSADPGRVARLHIREVGSPQWRRALLFRDWLRADGGARGEYGSVMREAQARFGDDAEPARDVQVAESWFDSVLPGADAWAASSGWVPSLH